MNNNLPSTEVKYSVVELTEEEQKKMDKMPLINIQEGRIIPNNISELFYLSRAVSVSGMAPKDKVDPGQCFVAALYGMSIGLDLMASIQNVSVVNQRPTVWGDGLLSVIKKTQTLEQFYEFYRDLGQPIAPPPPKFIADAFETDIEAQCIAKRKGQGIDQQEFIIACLKDKGHLAQADMDILKASGYFVNTFRYSEASFAKYFEKSNTPWQKTPRRMIKMRARAFTLRDGWADFLQGTYATEEMAGTDEDTVVLTEKDGQYEAEDTPPVDLKEKLKAADKPLEFKTSKKPQPSKDIDKQPKVKEKPKEKKVEQPPPGDKMHRPDAKHCNNLGDMIEMYPPLGKLMMEERLAALQYIDEHQRQFGNLPTLVEIEIGIQPKDEIPVDPDFIDPPPDGEAMVVTEEKLGPPKIDTFIDGDMLPPPPGDEDIPMESSSGNPFENTNKWKSMPADRYVKFIDENLNDWWDKTPKKIQIEMHSKVSRLMPDGDSPLPPVDVEQEEIKTGGVDRFSLAKRILNEWKNRNEEAWSAGRVNAKIKTPEPANFEEAEAWVAEIEAYAAVVGE